MYREPGIKLDAGDKLILEHLSRIENLLHSALPEHQHHSQGAASPAASAATAMSDDTMLKSTLNLSAMTTMGQQLPAGMGTWQNLSAMPKVHSTPALNLLQWPKIQLLVSRPYSPQQLLQLELSREPLHIKPSLTLNLSNTSAYVTAYFERVNVWYA